MVLPVAGKHVVDHTLLVAARRAVAAAIALALGVWALAR
jgi:hypothetical protein